MKLYRKIISLVLVIAFFNVILEKAVHEYFEHDFQVHACIDIDSTHFHDVEFAHLDFICDFNFSTNFFSDYKLEIKSVIHYFEKQLKRKYSFSIKDISLYILSYRGPPIIK